MPGLPTGTVTFLFTDVEGSPRLWEAHPEPMRAALVRHDALIEAAVGQHQGVVVRPRGEGDSRFAVFARAVDAVAATAAVQRALHAEPWPDGAPLRVRLAVHTGDADVREGDYYGSAVNRAARLRAIAHGGQALLSQATHDLVRDALPDGVAVRDLGEQRLADLARPERVFQLLHADLADAFPPLKSLDALPNNLPLQLTSFVGRERELAEVVRLLADSRLLTLTGSGGCGKTRLAIQAAADVLETYPDGAWFVDLAPLADQRLVAQAALAALGLREPAGRAPLEVLTEHLRPRTALLVADNCEHLLDGCARLADALLRACPRLTVLATSRELLGTAGEAAWRVPSLALPEVPDPAQLPPLEALARTEAVRLFAERAALVQPGFRVTADNARAVALVCVRLDGVPLALELAAARVRVLAPEQLAARLSDRFRLLTGGPHRAAAPADAAGGDRLESRLVAGGRPGRLPAPGGLHRRLDARRGRGGLRRWRWPRRRGRGIRPGRPDRRAQRAAGRDDRRHGRPARGRLDRLAELVDKSLVVTEAPAGGDAPETRYRLLETLRQYAEEQLLAVGEADAVRRRHAAHYLVFAERAAPALRSGGAAYVAALDRLDADLDNLRAALRWWLDTGDAASGLQLAVALRTFWRTRGYLAEGRDALTDLLALADQEASEAPSDALDQLRAQALSALAGVAASLGDYDDERRLAEHAIAIWRRLGEKPGVAMALQHLYDAASRQSDYATAQTILRERLALVEELGDRRGSATAGVFPSRSKTWGASRTSRGTSTTRSSCWPRRWTWTGRSATGREPAAR
jgi:predicted ATPase/class 3 adenylate cyclase